MKPVMRSRLVLMVLCLMVVALIAHHGGAGRVLRLLSSEARAANPQGIAPTASRTEGQAEEAARPEEVPLPTVRMPAG